MELIHHQVAQGAAAIGQAAVVGPEALHLGLEEQVIELLVVGEQDVGRGLVQGALVGDHAGGAHRRRGLIVGGTDVEPDPQTGQRGGGVNELGDAPGLIGGQGIHRVDEDRLDAPTALGMLQAAMVEERQQEALGFAGAGARGHQRVEGSA